MVINLNYWLTSFNFEKYREDYHPLPFRKKILCQTFNICNSSSIHYCSRTSLVNLSQSGNRKLILPTDSVKSSSSSIWSTSAPGQGRKHAILNTKSFFPNETTTSFLGVILTIFPTLPKTFSQKKKMMFYDQTQFTLVLQNIDRLQRISSDQNCTVRPSSFWGAIRHVPSEGPPLFVGRP